MTIQAMFETIAEVGFFNYFISFYREFPLTITVFCILSFTLGAGVAFLVLRLYPGRRKTHDQDRIRDQERPSKPKQAPSISGQSPPPGSRDLEHITDGWKLPGVRPNTRSALAAVKAAKARQSKKEAR